MLTLKIYGEITKEAERILISSWYESDELALSLNSVKQLIEAHPEENDIMLEIHGVGGYVSEGLAIYDYLRTSGKNIYANLIGEGHSMMVTLLLAAPIENRTANPNVSALVHRVNGFLYGVYSSKNLGDVYEDMKKKEDQIIDIYVERTGKSKEVMEELMSKEKELNAKELLEYGFISSINNYNTNSGKMTKEQIDSLLNKAKGLLSGSKDPKEETRMFKNVLNYGGSPVFNYDSLELGASVEFINKDVSSGIFISDEDGKAYVIAENKISACIDPAEVSELRNDNEALTAANLEMKNTINALNESLTELTGTVEYLRKNVKTSGASNFTTSPVRTHVRAVDSDSVSKGIDKNDAREKYKKAFKK